MNSNLAQILCRSSVTAPGANGACIRVRTEVMAGFPIRIVARKHRHIYHSSDGELCTAGYPWPEKASAVFVQLRDAHLTVTPELEKATLFADPASWLPRVIHLCQINAEHASHLEIGVQAPQRVKLPERTRHQKASLRAKRRADRAGCPVPIQ